MTIFLIYILNMFRYIVQTCTMNFLMTSLKFPNNLCCFIGKFAKINIKFYFILFFLECFRILLHSFPKIVLCLVMTLGLIPAPPFNGINFKSKWTSYKMSNWFFCIYVSFLLIIRKFDRQNLFIFVTKHVWENVCCRNAFYI